MLGEGLAGWLDGRAMVRLAALLLAGAGGRRYAACEVGRDAARDGQGVPQGVRGVRRWPPAGTPAGRRPWPPGCPAGSDGGDTSMDGAATVQAVRLEAGQMPLSD